MAETRIIDSDLPAEVTENFLRLLAITDALDDRVTALEEAAENSGGSGGSGVGG